MKTLILDLLSKSRFLVILGLITVALSQPIYSQTQNTVNINGFIQENGTKAPLEYASASLLTLKDSTLVKGAITKTNGGFTFTNVTPGTYKLRLSFVGYTTIRKTITIPGSPETQNLGSFQLDLLTNKNRNALVWHWHWRICWGRWCRYPLKNLNYYLATSCV